MGQAVQETVGGVGRRAAGVVAHPDGEHGVLGRRHGHPGAGGDFEDDEAEAGGDRVGEPREGRLLAVAAQQVGVFGVTRGQQFGLEPEGDEAGGVCRVGGGDSAARLVGKGRAGCLGAARLAPRGGVLCLVVAHGRCSLPGVVLAGVIRS